jgi:CMP-N,N'-diacetyllegionaminic acid synthase
MYKKKKILVIIPARKGSKGLKNKHLLRLGNKKLIEWVISSSKKVNLVDKILLTTDSSKIRKIALNNSISSPFLRPKKLSTDKAKSSDVIIHALDFLKKKKEEFDFFILLEPTSPFTTAKDIEKSIKLFVKNYDKFNSLVSVSKFNKISLSHIFNFKNNKIIPIFKKFENEVRRQDMPELTYLDGSIYIAKVENYIKNKQFLNNKTLAILFDYWKSIEIDTNFDLILAEKIFSKFKKKL